MLQALPGAERMVMGHTIQGQGVNAACEGRALRVDVGMSKGCGNGDVEALEILQDGKQVSAHTYTRSVDTHRQTHTQSRTHIHCLLSSFRHVFEGCVWLSS